MNTITILLNTESGGNPLIFFVLVLVFLVFYDKTTSKKQKQERKFRENLKKGDKIITSGGLHGKVVEVSEKTVKIDVGSSIVLKFDKTGISAELSNLKE